MTEGSNPENSAKKIRKQLGKKLSWNSVTNAKRILFLEDISDESEIWLMQCPKNVDPNSFVKKRLRLEDNFSLNLTQNDQDKNYTAFVTPCENEFLSMALPSRITKSININVLPLSGRMILQEDFKLSVAEGEQQVDPEAEAVDGILIKTEPKHENAFEEEEGENGFLEIKKEEQFCEEYRENVDGIEEELEIPVEFLNTADVYVKVEGEEEERDMPWERNENVNGSESNGGKGKKKKKKDK